MISAEIAYLGAYDGCPLCCGDRELCRYQRTRVDIASATTLIQAFGHRRQVQVRKLRAELGAIKMVNRGTQRSPDRFSRVERLLLGIGILLRFRRQRCIGWTRRLARRNE